MRKKWRIINKKLKVTCLINFLVFCLLPIALYAANDLSDISADSIEISMEKNGAFGKVIKSIETRGLTRINEDELKDLICFNIGEILERKLLSSGIRRAFKKGIFLDIRVASEPKDDGIKLVYIVKEIPVVKEILVEGNQHLSSGKIKDKLLYKEDEDFREEFIEKARADLILFYQRKGFHDASVIIRVKEADARSLANIVVEIQEGEPLIVKSIDLPDDARRYLRVSVGDILDDERLEKDIERMRVHYKKEKYVRPVVGPYEFNEGQLRIPVETGPLLELKFRGNSVISRKKLEKVVTFFDDEEVEDDSVEETVNRIKNLYLGKGHYYATIAAGIESDEERITVSFFIVEGEKVVLKKIEFDGVSISKEAVKEIIPLKENKAYNKNFLKNSRESIMKFYRALGYLKINIEEIKKAFNEDGSELNIVFVINEGPQTIIREIRITGNSKLSESKIKRAIRLMEGSPYNLIDIGDARYRLLSLYRRYGYVDAYVDIESVVDMQDSVLTFKITENKPAIIGKIIIRGNHKTKAKIIWREFTVDEGDPYNYEELLKIKQRLYKLGLFNEVSIEMLDSGWEKDGKLVRDVIVSLKEGKAGSVEFGIGYGDYEQLRGSIDVRYKNLGGYNRQVGFKTELSSVEQRYVFNFKEPWLFNEPDIPLNVFLTREETQSVNIETREVIYEIDRISLIINIGKELTKELKASFSYEYSFTDTSNVDPDVVLSREDTGTIGIGSISPALFYDTRDDPFEPSAGSIHGIIIKFASEAFLSETEFVKGTLQSSWFFEVYKKVVLALSFKGGAAYSFDDNKELPLIERFFLGGRTTVRGYDQDMLGPKGPEGNPTGGNVFSLVNTEFRIPLWKGLGLVTFMDTGNVWVLAGDTDERHKYTVGAGLRYSTPVGPVRVDYGYKLNREEDQSAGEFHFSFGHAF
ncbi:MAG: outer membrane protein assembly factor BamA [Nitrospirota bacterium]